MEDTVKHFLKKIIAALLAVFLIALSFPLCVSAYYEKQLSLGEVVYVTYSDDNPDEYYSFTGFFIPEKSGYYSFYSMGESDPSGSIMDSNFTTLAYNNDSTDMNFNAVYYLNAGEKYYLYSSLYSYPFVMDYYVSIREVDAPAMAEKVEISPGGTVTVYKGEDIYLDLLCEPAGAFTGKCTWESDLFYIADVSQATDRGCRVYAWDEGTATITVTTETGLTDSVVINCIDVPWINTDEPCHVSFNGSGTSTRCFWYTPEEYDFYTISTGGIDAQIRIYDPNREMVSMQSYYTDDGETVYKALLGPWDKYRVEIVGNGSDPDFDLLFRRCVDAESMSIRCPDGTKGYPGNNIELYSIFYPEFAREESVKWYSSDESVAYVGYNDERAVAQLLSVGTFEVTAVSESGLTASVVIESCYAEPMELWETREVPKGAVNVFSFKPTKSGYYSFVADGIDTSDVYITEREFYIVGGYYLDFENGVVEHQAYLNKGVEYYLYSRDYRTDGGDTYTVSVKECKNATSLTLDKGDTIYARKGETIELPFTFGPDGALWDGVEVYGDVELYHDFEIEKEQMKIVLTLHKECVKDILVVSDRGLRAECTVNVTPLEFIPLTEGVEHRVDSFLYENEYFSFTPEKDGSYTVYSTGGCDAYLYTTDTKLNLEYADDDSGKGYNFAYTFDARAGETYYFRTSYYDSWEEYGVTVEKSSTANSMKLDCGSFVYGDVGEVVYVNAEFIPYGSEIEEVHWVTDDSSVLQLYPDEGKNSCMLYLCGEGTTTLCAYTDSGFYAEVTVVVGGDILFGDLDGSGSLNSIDANLIKRYLSGLSVQIVLMNADVNADGIVDARDSNLLKRILAGQK